MRILSGLLPPDPRLQVSQCGGPPSSHGPSRTAGILVRGLAAELHEGGWRNECVPQKTPAPCRPAGTRQKARSAPAATSLRDARDLIASAGGNWASPPRNGSLPRAFAGSSSLDNNRRGRRPDTGPSRSTKPLVQAFALAGDHVGLVPVADQLIGRLKTARESTREREALIRVKAARDHVGGTARPTPPRHLAAARAIADDIGDPALSSQVDGSRRLLCGRRGGDMDKARLRELAQPVARAG